MLLSSRSFRMKVNGSFYPPSSRRVGTLPTRPDKPSPRRTLRSRPPTRATQLGQPTSVTSTEVSNGDGNYGCAGDTAWPGYYRNRRPSRQIESGRAGQRWVRVDGCQLLAGLPGRQHSHTGPLPRLSWIDGFFWGNQARLRQGDGPGTLDFRPEVAEVVAPEAALAQVHFRHHHGAPFLRLHQRLAIVAVARNRTRSFGPATTPTRKKQSWPDRCAEPDRTGPQRRRRCQPMPRIRHVSS